MKYDAFQPNFPDLQHPHLWKSPSGVFHFRIVFPKSADATPFGGRRSFKRSLQTRCPKEALRKAQSLWALHFGDKHAIALSMAYARSTTRYVDPEHPESRTGLFHDMLREPSAISPSTGEPDTLMLSEAVRMFVREGSTGNGWEEKTVQQHTATLKLLVDYVGDKPLALVSRPDLIELREKLKVRPTHLNKRESARRNGRLKPDETLSVGTINNILGRVSTFFAWTQRNDLSDRNPAQRLKLKDDTHPRDKRASYSVEDLQHLLNGYERFLKHKPQPYQFWLPLLGMFTGARLEELCQLHIEDVIIVGGVQCISINNEAEKKLKTRSSVRLVPIHSTLLKLGFLDFVEDRKRKQKPRLFTELRRKRDGYHPQASKWFNEKFKRRCVLSPGKKDFHSFRHTVADWLKQKHLSKERVAALLGHCDGSETFDRYGKAYLAEGMKDVVEALDYPLDLSIPASVLESLDAWAVF